MPKALITDYVHHKLIAGLETMGYEVTYQKDIPLEETKTIIDQYEGIVVNSKTIMDKDMMDKGSALKWIGRLGSGLDIIDLPYAKSKGIHVYNAPEGNRNAVAEHTLGMMLCLSNQILRADQEVRNFMWNRESRRGVELMGKTIGIIGMGNTGSALAHKLRSFGVEVIAYDKYHRIFDPAYNHVRWVSLEDLCAQADIISIHVQLTEETQYLVEDTFLDKCKEGVILINTSRGKVVNIQSVLRYLQNGKIGGLGLDVFPNEKTSTFTKQEKEMYEELYQHPNTVFTPHIAGWTAESLERISDVLLTKIGANI
jgi:D-3-phosphoglycerate dehydrogenase